MTFKMKSTPCACLPSYSSDSSSFLNEAKCSFRSGVKKDNLSDMSRPDQRLNHDGCPVLPVSHSHNAVFPLPFSPSSKVNFPNRSSEPAWNTGLESTVTFSNQPTLPLDAPRSSLAIRSSCRAFHASSSDAG